MKTALILLLLAHPLWAQSFESRAAQATTLLQQHKLDKANGVKTPWSERDKASLAGDAWLAAAQVAATDAQRFQAYESAGLAYADSQTLGDEALKAFRLAREVTGVSGEQRARAGILAARRARTRAEWELITALAGATPEQLATAYHEIGTSYLVAAKSDVALNLKVIEGYEKAAQQMASYNPQAADTELGMASVTAHSLPPSPATTAVVDRIYKSLLALPLSPEQKPLRNARLELNWGSSLQKVKALERAISLWEKVGKNTAYPAEQREEGWLKAAEALKGEGKIDKALAALQAATPLRADNFVFSTKLAEKKLDLLIGPKRYGEALQVVQALAKHPKLPADHRERLVIEQAKYLYKLARAREAEALLAPLWRNPPRGGDTIYQITVLKAQDALDRKEQARARREVDAGLARVRELSSPTNQLEYISARLSVAEKNYTKALESYTNCARTAGVVAPSETVLTEVRQMFNQALAEKKLAEAQAISEAVANWRVDPILPPLLQAQLAAAAGDAATARAAVARCRQELNRFYGASKEAWEKELAAIEAGLR
ncbi:MAG: hypothetical protein KF760_29605 [Candidatus Eremiobacteraeota bacterium]|nr:hypothetical protein [Candidatus Eremiobacteraeota bacterium]MCW5872285.1 hypothetical protein [Candidatus Eremiobacteraeota bacterium]